MEGSSASPPIVIRQPLSRRYFGLAISVGYLWGGAAMAIWSDSLWYRGFGVFLAVLGLWMLPRVVASFIRPHLIVVDREGVELRLWKVERRHWREIESIGPVRAQFTTAVVLRCGGQKPLWLQPWEMTAADLENLIVDARARWTGLQLNQQPQLDLTEEPTTGEPPSRIAQRVLGIALICASVLGHLQIGAAYRSPDGFPPGAAVQWKTPPSQSDFLWFGVQVLAVALGSWLVVRSRPTWFGRSWVQTLWTMAYAFALVGVFGLVLTIDLGSVWLGLTYSEHHRFVVLGQSVLTPGLIIVFVVVFAWFYVRRSMARIQQVP